MEEFIHVIEKSKGSIFIMGDFFDYYFEYNKNNPNYFEKIFLLLEKIKSKGIEIYFIAGNHDFWIGKEFESLTTKSFLNDQILLQEIKEFMSLMETVFYLGIKDIDY